MTVSESPRHGGPSMTSLLPYRGTTQIQLSRVRKGSVQSSTKDLKLILSFSFPSTASCCLNTYPNGRGTLRHHKLTPSTCNKEVPHLVHPGLIRNALGFRNIKPPVHPGGRFQQSKVLAAASISSVSDEGKTTSFLLRFSKNF